MGFSKNLSFKIAGWRAGVGCRPRLTFWSTFFQSYMLPLFFNGLLSYLVEMKRMTRRCFHVQERQLSLSSLFKKPIHSAIRCFSCMIMYLCIKYKSKLIFLKHIKWKPFFVHTFDPMKLKKGHKSHNNWWIYPKWNLTYILLLYTCV